MAEIIAEAARQGFPDADRLWGMSLAEAERTLEAHAARRRARFERDERLAWMAGYYFAIAAHAPRRYPRRSGTVFRAAGAARAMTEAQMKDALFALAAERAGEEAEYDAGNAED